MGLRQRGGGVRMDGLVVGTVVALTRFPVKSMRGEALDHARLGWHGLEGDRRYACVRADNTSRFPWLTARELPAMLSYVPSLDDPENPANAPLRVRTPAGVTLPIDDEALAAELAAGYGGPVRLMQLGRGAHDSMPLSLLTTAALMSLGTRLGQALDARRFRANVLIETMGTVSDAPEVGWLGGELVFGAGAAPARVFVARRITRCVMITLDPETTAAHPAVLRTVARDSDGCAGIYASVVTPGTLALGDSVRWIARERA